MFKRKVKTEKFILLIDMLPMFLQDALKDDYPGEVLWLTNLDEIDELEKVIRVVSNKALDDASSLDPKVIDKIRKSFRKLDEDFDATYAAFNDYSYDVASKENTQSSNNRNLINFIIGSFITTFMKNTYALKGDEFIYSQDFSYNVGKATRALVQEALDAIND
jgi:hypothetical protein